MTRVIAIERRGEGAMVALVVDGRLEDLLIDAPSDAPLLEEIHQVRVKRVIPGQGAALVRLQDGRKGYLRDAKGLKEGQLAIAQVSAYAEPGKAAPLTTKRLYRGRYAILTPGAPGVNVARSIKGHEPRARLEALAAGRVAEGAGLILRSAAAAADDDEILADIEQLTEMEASVAAAAAAHEPALLAEAPGAEATAWREWTALPVDDVVDEDEAFDRLGLWDELFALQRAEAKVQGGGWMAIEPTRAMVSIDVNTGDDMGAQAAAKANLGACQDLMRQLRLRGLGGQITVDFAPMRKQDRKAVESVLRRAAALDPVQTTLAGWTPLGHFEMLRKRERRPLSEVLPDA